MLSVLFAESGDNLAHLVRFYAPSAKRLLDVTYGGGTLTRRVSIPVTGIDKDPTSKAKIRADATALPFGIGTFDVAVYDPPYLYGSKARHMGLIGQKTWESARSTWRSPSELVSLSEQLASELALVLTFSGVVICKIMDSRCKGKLVRNHDIVTKAFEDAGWILRDQLVYIRTVTGSFVNSKSAQSAHGYYLVFGRQV